MNLRCKWITIEGGDGVGKSSFAQALVQKLQEQHIEVLHTREPGGVMLSEAIRRWLLDPCHEMSVEVELLLFLASRVAHMQSLVLPALQTKVVVCERFHDSTYVYQGILGGLGVERVHKIIQTIGAMPEPECTFLLDVDPAIADQRRKARGTTDRMENKELSFHQKVREAFLTLAHQKPDRIKILDATLPIQELVTQALVCLNF